MTLTKLDLGAIQDLMEVTLDEKLDKKLDEKLGKYPNKEEFYAETTRIYKKLEDLEIEKDVLSARVADHSDKIEALEKIHPTGRHFAQT